MIFFATAEETFFSRISSRKSRLKYNVSIHRKSKQKLNLCSKILFWGELNQFAPFLPLFKQY